MTMIYSDGIQHSTIMHKMRTTMAAIIKSVDDNDEAIDAREPEAMKRTEGFTVSMYAPLDYYWSTGTGTPLLDRLAQRCLDAQAAEWASQYPDRETLPECAMNEESPHHSEAQEWETAAFTDEGVWLRVEATVGGDSVTFASCFTDDINVPIGLQYRETVAYLAFLAMDDSDLELLIDRIAEAPYLSIIAKRNSGGMWHAWLGTDDGRVAYFACGGHETEAAARAAVDTAARYA